MAGDKRSITQHHPNTLTNVIQRSRRTYAVICTVVFVGAIASIRPSFSFTNESRDHQLLLQQADANTPRRNTKEKELTSTSAAEPQFPHDSIPHTLWFTHQHDILQTKQPKFVYDNILNTINTYRQAWNEPNASVHFLDNKQCKEIIYQVKPKLVPYFEMEKYGEFKVDICRIAVLYLHGGYYFDVDIEVIKPVLLESYLTFASVMDPRGTGFFQAFMASSKHNLILERNLNLLLKAYEGKLVLNDSIGSKLKGPVTIKMAYDSIPISHRENNMLILQEVNLKWYPNLYSQYQYWRGGYGCCCTFLVHDPAKEEVYFWSRIVGYSVRCRLTPEEEEEVA